MEDGPPSSVTSGERLQLLRKHTATWDSMAYTATVDIPMESGCWDFYGGIFAEEKQGGLAITQLPSQLRGIPHLSWELQDIGVDIQDFRVDPAQDLLVIADNGPTGPSAHTIHLRSLSTGKPHPSAEPPSALHYIYPNDDVGLCFHISGNYLGILFLQQDGSNALVIWDWKSGNIVMESQSDAVRAFCFLSDRHILVAQGDPTYGVVIVIYDFTPSDNLVSSDLPQPVCVFQYPEMILPYDYKGKPPKIGTLTIDMFPSPGWTPHPSLSVPFHLDRDQRLIQLTVSFIRHRKAVHFFPISPFLRQISLYRSSMVATGRQIPWQDWAQNESCMRIWDRPTDFTSVCSVYGTSRIYCKAHINPNYAGRTRQ
ncbi:hypothetical protein BXZ70DRAFT_52774 [Cristinia sonorae]|uniref:Uncharacterized protein n=1 Tax=Cristinia sonorae TaxID=1940300 RepID=A0A8K0XRP2_9AGAR|nr:hypothetical protein BXZ70DRAFT_52774 [Cristinia sonorae]